MPRGYTLSGTYFGSAKLSGVCYGSTNFVAVGGNGAIITSPDGISWSLAASKTTNNLAAVLCAQGHFLAVGNQGTILTSADGVAWSLAASGTTNDLVAVTFGQGEFVAVGNNWEGGGVILTSQDGASWFTSLMTFTDFFQGVAYGNNRFVAVAYGGTALNSTDGTNWAEVSAATNLVDLSDIIYLNKGFSAFAYDPNSYQPSQLSSPDGISWTSKPMGVQPFNIAQGTGMFAAVANFASNFINGNPWQHIVISLDATNWVSPASIDPNINFSSISYGAGRFVAVAGNPWGTASVILTSSDGRNWTSRAGAIPTELFESVAFGNNQWLAVGRALYTSSDGFNWVTNANGTYWASAYSYPLYSIAFGGDQFVAVGPGTGTEGEITGSDTAWNDSRWYPGIPFYGVAYGKNVFVAVGGNGGIVTIPSGYANALSIANVTTSPLYGIAYGNNTFVVVGDLGTVITSTNGINWTSQSFPTLETLNAVTYGSNVFVAVGSHGAILTSLDGTNWLTQSSSTGSELRGIGYGNNEFAAVGAGGTILTSSNSTNWTSVATGTDSVFRGVAYGDNQFLTVGDSGAIWGTPQPPLLGPVVLLSELSLQVGLQGSMGAHYGIEVSTNLVTWENFTNVTLVDHSGSFKDSTGLLEQRYYRAYIP